MSLTRSSPHHGYILLSFWMPTDDRESWTASDCPGAFTKMACSTSGDHSTRCVYPCIKMKRYWPDHSLLMSQRDGVLLVARHWTLLTLYHDLRYSGSKQVRFPFSLTKKATWLLQRLIHSHWHRAYFPGWGPFQKYSNVAIVALIFFPMAKTKTRVLTTKM